MKDSGIDGDFGFKTEKAKNWINKQRTLILSNKGTTERERGLLQNFLSLLPQSKRDGKLEKKNIADQIESCCDLQNTSNFIYLEKKKRNTFLWVGKYPDGPTLKYQVDSCNHAKDKRFLGNCLKSSRPILSFDSSFQNSIVKKIEKNIWVDALNVPKNHPKSQPFIDKIYSFKHFNGKLEFRNFQISQKGEKATDIELFEIGPRMKLELVRIFEGVMRGKILYVNESYKKPSELRNNKNERIKKIHKQKLESRNKKNRLKEERSNEQQLGAYDEFLNDLNE